VNNRVGRVKFDPQAAQAAMAIGADVLVFNEFVLVWASSVRDLLHTSVSKQHEAISLSNIDKIA
jgi:hypothetical protein